MKVRPQPHTALPTPGNIDRGSGTPAGLSPETFRRPEWLTLPAPRLALDSAGMSGATDRAGLLDGMRGDGCEPP